MIAKHLRTALPLLVVLASSRAAVAETYYVGPKGTDTAAGTSREAPSTPAAIQSKLAPGDVVIFLDGVYPTKETTKVTKSGTKDAPITFRADEGAVPIFSGPGEEPDQGAWEAGADVGYLVFEGLWFENWGSGALEFDWDFKDCHDITMRYNVADQNGRGGFAPYNSENATIEYNISSRNGYRSDGSWSSNINVWGTSGTVVVRGNVAFHSVDTSSNNSDGNGFIADLTLSNTKTLFENNIGFGNGGACIAITDSGNATLIGNTCFNNNKRAPTNDFNFVNTCRSGSVDGIPVNGRAWTSGLVVQNNVLSGGIKTVGSCGAPSYQGQNNVQNASGVFQDTDAADFRPKAGSSIVDKVAHGTTFPTDIGFDPKCIKVETDQAKKHGYSWWTHGPDLDYIKKIGGIKKCWSPRTRPQGSNQEIGAYELVTDGCTTAASCDDKDACTVDACGADGECTHTAISGCGAAGTGGTAGTAAVGGTSAGTQASAGKNSGGQGGANTNGSTSKAAKGGAGGTKSSMQGNAGEKSAQGGTVNSSNDSSIDGVGGSDALGGTNQGSSSKTTKTTSASGKGGSKNSSSTVQAFGGSAPSSSSAAVQTGDSSSDTSGCSCSVPQRRRSLALELLGCLGVVLASRRRRSHKQ